MSNSNDKLKLIVSTGLFQRTDLKSLSLTWEELNGVLLPVLVFEIHSKEEDDSSNSELKTMGQIKSEFMRSYILANQPMHHDVDGDLHLMALKAWEATL